MASDAAVVVYGATGYTGRLICAALARRGVPFIAAGRDADTLAALRIAFSMGGRPTRGTTRSALLHAHQGGFAYVDGEWRREPLAAERWEVDFPAPVGRRACVSVPWGDVATAPRSTGARTVRTF